MYFKQYQQSKNPTCTRMRSRTTGPTSPPTTPGSRSRARTRSRATSRTTRCRRCRGSSRRSATTSTRPRHRRSVSGTRPRSSRPSMSNPDVWASTVLFIMYDENDGWFDHVKPPTAPAGTAGRVRHREVPGEGLPRTDRPRIPGPDARRLSVQHGRMGVLRRVRPHVTAPVPGPALRGDGPQRVGVAQEDRRRPHGDAADALRSGHHDADPAGDVGGHQEAAA